MTPTTVGATGTSIPVDRAFSRAGDRAKARVQQRSAAAVRTPVACRPRSPGRTARLFLAVVAAWLVAVTGFGAGSVPAQAVSLAAGDPTTTPSPTTTPPTTPKPTTTPPPTTPPTSPPTTAPPPTSDPSTTTTTTTTPPGSTAPSSTTTTEPGGISPTIEPDEVPPEERDLIERYRDLEKGAADLLTQLRILNGGIAAAQDDLLKAQKRLDDAEHQIERTEQRLADTEDQLAAQRDLLRVRAVAAYIGGPSSFSSGAAMLKATSVDEVEKSLAYGGALVDDERAVINRTIELKRDVEALNAQAQGDRESARQARDDLVARRGGLEQQRDAIIAAEAGLQKNAQDKIGLLSEAAQRQLLVEAGFARVQAVRDSISNTLASRQVGQTPPASTLGIFLSPIPNPRINQPFGASYDPLFRVSRGHPGLDINGRTGDPIRAPADGVVVAAGWIDGYGNCIIIDHGGALGTLYGHQSVLIAKEGDTVIRGQVIGLVGSTGYSTGPHLHWEVRVLGNVVDPAPFIGETR